MGRSLLFMCGGFLIIFGMVRNSVTQRQMQIPELTADYFREMEVRNIASSLMEYGIRRLDDNQEWKAGYGTDNLLGAEVQLSVYGYSEFQASDPGIPTDHDIENWDQYKVLLVSRAVKNGLVSTVEVAMSKDAFSKYTYFTDQEDDGIYFFDGDVLEGPVHTNGQMNIAGSPTFKGYVTSPNDWVGHPSYENDPQFEAGFDFSSQEKEMPDSEKLSLLKNQGLTGGLSFDEEVMVEFGADGTVEISTWDPPENWWDEGRWVDPRTHDIDSFNGVISSSKRVHTKGTVNGQVTLHSEEEVNIIGDLQYATDPQVDSTSTDILGIVSEGEVVVDLGAHNDNGNGDLTIHASIMALDESFEVENYSSGNPRGVLNLVGGLQQQRRGAVGTFGGGGVQSGYSKNYSYDHRLQEIIPPFYPRESFYSQKYWKEHPVLPL